MINSEHFSYDLESDTEPFGYEIASLVADKLKTGQILGYGHRDYCGMGMKADENQRFLYGEIYDGIDFSNPRIFETKDVFVEWLAAQSTASLARLDDEEFFQGNQIISRKRLLDFIK
ncbi:hypothetical protein ACM46_16735 [Chryseobacterium angstadtii]|uniref:Uncharacterized protein n=1 Tax=Chryseobacterium angstadtii TaxID=558151 RepID=A0A0J7KX55_9FLAO|nr:hypothetical protein [Chryseobacterium angstadtii]KMQ61635.1 hypothetical protein ACM46_16735 [Chryseobacterium angstadtii]